MFYKKICCRLNLSSLILLVDFVELLQMVLVTLWRDHHGTRGGVRELQAALLLVVWVERVQ